MFGNTLCRAETYDSNAYSSLENSRSRTHAGFTLIELMIVVGIIGTPAAIAIPNFVRFQLKSKTAEATVNLAAIRVVEDSHYIGNGTYLAANPEPPAVPGQTPGTFDDLSADFAQLGFGPEGRVYFSYSVAIAADGSGYTSDAVGDIDGNGTNQIWGYAEPDLAGAIVDGTGGCVAAQLASPEQVGACAPEFGQSEF